MDEQILSSDPAARKRTIGGIVMLLLGAACAYFFMYLPVHTAMQTGQLEYYVKGILLPPICLYMALILLVTDIRDGQLRRLNAKGKPTFTKKGWWVMAGALATMGLTLAGWFFYLHALGFRSAS